ncbi:hypothetical protein [Streptantibioticus rubrisoli]|jgi:hypothetical protein|uniref:Uncharacterized protein n=1 Tax=Streptantibioticus rubrisoli TaxID=1387313 RepID=A0ABT1PMX3_9ACTN|nr:hypothetical protein [Streptantibioticus rubrisoli]MCQ4046699.1 hypothetical protein [Streptantibioticus rubrisoli]
MNHQPHTPSSAVDLAKAIAEVRQSEGQADLYAVVLASLAAQQAAQGHGCGCQHHAPAPAPQRGSVARPLAIGAGVVAGGCVLTGLFLAVALTAVAVGVSSVVLLILVRELRKGSK